MQIMHWKLRNCSPDRFLWGNDNPDIVKGCDSDKMCISVVHYSSCNDARDSAWYEVLEEKDENMPAVSSSSHSKPNRDPLQEANSRRQEIK